MNYNQNFVSQKDFTEIMNIMADVFPNINNRSRIKYYFNAVKDLPLEALRDISKSFLTSAKQMPLPNDFLDAARDWKRKHNYQSHIEEAEVILCNKCGDLGIVRIQHHNDLKFEELLRCDCGQIIGDVLKTPIWANDLHKVFKVSPCPLYWFKPQNTSAVDFNNSEIINILSEWKRKKKKSEKYWSDLGYEHK